MSPEQMYLCSSFYISYWIRDKYNCYQDLITPKLQSGCKHALGQALILFNKTLGSQQLSSRLALYKLMYRQAIQNNLAIDTKYAVYLTTLLKEIKKAS